MAQYATVVWSEGDEVTSQKLEQMAQNETWIKDNLIVGNANYVTDPNGATSGRVAGIQTITKMEVVEIAYDSQVPVLFYDFTVVFPPVFTEPPVIFISNYDHDEASVLRVFTKNGTTNCIIRVWNTSYTTHRKRGHASIMLVGK
jgi:hypothetical protein